MNMSFDDMQKAWNTSGNNLGNEELHRLAEQFTRQVVRRRRFQGIWLAQTFLSLTAVSGFAIWSVAKGQTGLRDEWALLPLLVAPWFFAVHFLRRYLQLNTSKKAGELGVVDSLRAALESNRSEIKHLRLVVLLFVIMVPILAVSIQQLHEVGKISMRELNSVRIFFGSSILVSLSGIAAWYFGRLEPQKRKLIRILGEVTEKME
jgi:hypothetical protein